MVPCAHFQEQLLDHLYGLLEPDQARELAAHLEDCDACRQALARAEAERRLLATAARVGFTQPAFEAPMLRVATRQDSPTRESHAHWSRWALAAGIVFAVAATTLSATTYRARRNDVALASAEMRSIEEAIRQRALENSEQVARADREVRSAREELARVESEEQERRVAARRMTADRQLRLAVSGPAVPQAGVANVYQVQVQNQRREPVAAQLDARIVDPTRNALPQQVRVQNQGQGNFLLQVPPDVPLGPSVNLALQVNAQRDLRGIAKDKAGVTFTEEVPLSAPPYVTELAIDSPSYWPGDIVHFRSLTVERASLRPAPEPLQLEYGLTTPTGENSGTPIGWRRLSGPDGSAIAGLAAGEWVIPAKSPEGEYTLTVSEAANRFPPQERRFLVHRSERVPGTKQPVAAPEKVNFEFFPEGGELVGELPNRVYFRARTQSGRPVDVRGRIVDGAGRAVAVAETFKDFGQRRANHGLGVFEFMPVTGQRYELRIESGSASKSGHVLPDVKADGVVLLVRDAVVGENEPFRLTLQSRTDRMLVVAAQCRGRVVAQERIDVRRSAPTLVTLRPQAGADGICRIFIYEELPGRDGAQLIPRADRLVYRMPARRLKLAVRSDRAHYAPGERVRLEVTARDEKGEPARAVGLVSAVDREILERASQQTLLGLPTSFLFGMELHRPEDVEYADFLIQNLPRTRMALDLILATQGGRSRGEPDFDKSRQGDKTPPVFASATQQSSKVLTARTFNLDTHAGDERVAAEFRPKLDTLHGKLENAESHARKVEDDNRGRDAEIVSLREQFRAAQKAHEAATHELESFQNTAGYLKLALLVLLAVVGVASVAVAIARRLGRRAAPAWLVAACCLVLAALTASIGPSLLKQPFVQPEEEKIASAMTSAENSREAPSAPPQFRPDGNTDQAVRQPAGLNTKAQPNRSVPAPGQRMESAAQRSIVPAAEPAAQAPALPSGGGETVKRAQTSGLGGASAPKVEGLKKETADDAVKTARGPADLQGKLKQAPEPGRGLADREQAAAKAPALQSAAGAPAEKPGGLEGTRSVQRAARLASPPTKQEAQDDKRRIANPLANGASAVGGGGAANAPMAPVPSVRDRLDARFPEGSALGAGSAQTIYWNPALVMSDGTAQASFDLPALPATYRVLIVAHNADGRLGAVSLDIDSRQPRR
jgi:hypothetical protein